jgi:hypothetical protein
LLRKTKTRREEEAFSGRLSIKANPVRGAAVVHIPKTNFMKRLYKRRLWAFMPLYIFRA